MMYFAALFCKTYHALFPFCFMKHSYLLAASLLLFSACGKDDEPELNLPGEYQAENRIAATSINMYTSNGQVNNTGLIDKFIRRNRVEDYFSRTDVAIPSGNTLTLSIDSNNKATFVSTASSPQRTDTLKAEIISRSQDHLALAEFDSISTFTSTQSNRCGDLSQSMAQVQPSKRCRPVAFSAGTTSQVCRYRPASALLIKDGGLRLPFLSCMIVNRQGGNNCGNGYSGVRNMFNTAVLNQLRTGDTIVVQVREVPFIKQ
jgi:hypothetical protein